MKYSIRELLLVTVIAALAVAWWVDRRRLAAEIGRQGTEIERLRESTPRRPTIRIPMHLGRVPMDLGRATIATEPAPNPPKE